MSEKCSVRYQRSKSTDASPRTPSPTPPRLRRAHSQGHLPAASSPSSAERAYSSLDSSLSPGDASRRAPGRLYRRHSPRNLSEWSEALPPCISPRLTGQRSPAEGEGGVSSRALTPPRLPSPPSQQHVLTPSSPDPSFSSTDCSPEYRTEQEPRFVYDQLSRRSLDVTTESEVTPLLQEEMDVEETATNQGIATATPAGNVEAFSVCADNESFDVKVWSCATDSMDTGNSNAWVPATEILQSPPRERGPQQLWCEQQASSQMSTAQVGSTPVFVESLEMGGATYYSVQPSYQFSPTAYPAPPLSFQPTIYPMVWGSQTPTTQFRVVAPTYVYQFPSAQRSVPMMGTRGVARTEIRMLGPVPMPGTSYLPTQSPQTYPHSPSSFLPTNQPPNPTVLASPAASREVLPFMESSAYQFPDTPQTVAALGAAGARSTMTEPLGSAQIVQTTTSLHKGFPDTLPIATPTYSAANQTMFASPSSLTKPTAPVSSVEISMLSNLSDFRASAGLKDGPKEVPQTEVSSVVNKEPTCSVTMVEDVAENRGTMVAAGGDITSRISSKITDFVLTTIRSHLMSNEENSRGSVQTTELQKLTPYQMTESSADPWSNCQQPVIMDIAPKMLHDLSLVSTPSANPALKSTVVILPKSSEQPTAPMPSVESSMLSNLSDFLASARGRGMVSRKVAKTVLSSARHEDHSTYCANTEPGTPGTGLTWILDAQGPPRLPLLSGDVQNKEQSFSVWKPIPPAVTDESITVTQPTGIQPVEPSQLSLPSYDVRNEPRSSYGEPAPPSLPPAVKDVRETVTQPTGTQSHGSPWPDRPLSSNWKLAPPPLPSRGFRMTGLPSHEPSQPSLSSDDVQNEPSSSDCEPAPPSLPPAVKDVRETVTQPTGTQSLGSPWPDRPLSSNWKLAPPPLPSQGFRMTGLPSHEPSQPSLPSDDVQNEPSSSDCEPAPPSLPPAIKDVRETVTQPTGTRSHGSSWPDRPRSSNWKLAPPPLPPRGFRMTGLPSWQRWVSIRHPFASTLIKRWIIQSRLEALSWRCGPPRPPGFVPYRLFPQSPVSAQAARGQVLYARNPPFPRPRRLRPTFAATPRMTVQPPRPVTPHGASGPASTIWHYMQPAVPPIISTQAGSAHPSLFSAEAVVTTSSNTQLTTSTDSRGESGVSRGGSKQ